MTTTPTIGTREEWLKARLELLEAEKEHTRRSDELAAKRQALPRVRIDKTYEFDTDEGRATLPDLFRGRSQLLVYHFMFGPDYAAGCPSCSAIADGFDRSVVHHTYSAYARGLDALWGMYQWLDRAPKGRNETGAWFRRHDEYKS